jgi:putative flippase GtrA
MSLFPVLVYLLCLLTSATCAGLLFRAWRRDGSRLLLWTAAAFGFFALNNLTLVLDMMVFPDIDLWPARMITNVLGFVVLLWGFVWESGR